MIFTELIVRIAGKTRHAVFSQFSRTFADQAAGEGTYATVYKVCTGQPLTESSKYLCTGTLAYYK